MSEVVQDHVEAMEQVEAASEPATTEAEPSGEVDERVADLEKKFEDRYTEKDEAFKAALESKEASPPVVPNFGVYRYNVKVFYIS